MMGLGLSCTCLNSQVVVHLASFLPAPPHTLWHSPVGPFYSAPVCNFKLIHQIPPSSAVKGGGPSELETEESKFVPLNADDPVYGPPALLLLGFEVEEMVQIRQLLKELDGEFLQIIFCTDDMIQRSLWEAMHTKQSNLDTIKIAKPLPRICFLSGLSGEETIMFIDAFTESGLEPSVFAALVPKSADKPLQELIEEIMGDHEMVTGQKSNSA